MKHSAQLTDNSIDGDVPGTSIQADSIGQIRLGESRKPRSRKGLWYLSVPAAAAVVGITALAWELDEPTSQSLVTASTSPPAPTSDTTSSTPMATVTSIAARVARPATAGQAPRQATATTLTTPAPTTTTVAIAAAPPPAESGVRFNGELQFGSQNLDLAQPRDVDGRNVWPLTPGRLHGDEGYWLSEWAGDGVPGRDECAADLTQRATRDAENLVVGSRVCGKTPGGRIFLVEVVAMDGATITGQVTVWE